MSSQYQQKRRIPLSQFSNPSQILDEIEGRGIHGDITASKTHEGYIVSGNVPQQYIPHHHDENMNNQKQQQQQQVGERNTSSSNHFALALQEEESKIPSIQAQLQQSVSNNDDNNNVVEPPPKTLGWLHKQIEDFFEFRTRQFDIKNGNILQFALNDETDKANRMIVPSPISDDVAFYLFEMISERYGVPSVVAQQCEVVLRTAKYFSTKDISAALFFSLLRSSSFDSNDIRFLVEAKRKMRSSLISQRGVDGILRWFVPLRLVPTLIRRACEHPWTRSIIPKVHSAFEKLFLEQQHKNRAFQLQREQEQELMTKEQSVFWSSGSNSNRRQQQSTRNTNNSKQQQKQPLFTLPAPHHLVLVPPYAEDHPLIGRGPFVDSKKLESFLASQPSQLVIGADYLLCLLFVNWIDHREHTISDFAEGRAMIRSVHNRRAGKVTSSMTLGDEDAASIAKLGLFALDLKDVIITSSEVDGGGGDSNAESRSSSKGSSSSSKLLEHTLSSTILKQQSEKMKEQQQFLDYQQNSNQVLTMMDEIDDNGEIHSVQRRSSPHREQRAKQHQQVLVHNKQQQQQQVPGSRIIHLYSC